MKLSKLFSLVLKEFEIAQKESRKLIFICRVINENPKITVQDAIRAKDLINSRLSGHLSLESWLYSHVPEIEIYTAKRNNTFHKKVLATRIAWLNSLIAEFKAKGD